MMLKYSKMTKTKVIINVGLTQTGDIKDVAAVASSMENATKV